MHDGEDTECEERGKRTKEIYMYDMEPKDENRGLDLVSGSLRNRENRKRNEYSANKIPM